MKVGILGGGQLARMLALAGYPMGIRTLCVDSQASTCAGDVTEVLTCAYDDAEKIRGFAKQVDVVTYETENIPVNTAEIVSELCELHPNMDALATCQDRLLEKNLFSKLGINTPRYAKIDSLDELTHAVEQIGLPVILKTRRFGYDGKGQALLRDKKELTQAWEQLGKHNLILEEFIHFDCEVSIIAVRNKRGAVNYYPLTENTHREGILRLSVAPYVNETLQQQAQQYAAKIMAQLNYVGVLAIEFFAAKQQLIANEMAPRVHNSGHWTIEGADTSQFANHLQAILDLPLGSTKPRGHCAMINFISTEPTLSEVLTLPQAHYHTYGKEPRKDRKLGHATLVSNDEKLFQSQMVQLKKLINLT